MRYGEIIKSEDLTIYIVETTFPDPKSPEKFGQYGWDSYTPKDNPGHRNLFFRDPRWKALLEVRQTYDWPRFTSHEFNDSLAYANPGHARVCARALTKHAVLAHPYEHGTDWSEKLKGLHLKARVVELRRAMVRRIVLP